MEYGKLHPSRLFYIYFLNLLSLYIFPSLFEIKFISGECVYMVFGRQPHPLLISAWKKVESFKWSRFWTTDFRIDPVFRIHQNLTYLFENSFTWFLICTCFFNFYMFSTCKCEFFSFENFF